MLKNKNNFEIINSFFHCLAENFSDHPCTMKRESKVVPMNILKTYEVMELLMETFLTSALDGNE
jgi:hypothetical protein